MTTARLERTPLGRLAGGVRGLAGWRRLLAALVAGAVATLALPPVYAVPVLVPAFTVLVWLIAASRGLGGALAVGWLFGFGHFLSGFYWVGHAFTVAGVMPWLAPFAVAGMAALAALFPALAAVATRAFGRGPAVVAVFAVMWTAAEWLRAYGIFGGFPWNLIGYVWSYSDSLSQFAAYGGAFGLSFATVLAAVLPAAAAWLVPGRARLAPLAGTGAIVLALWAVGAARLPDGPVAEVADVRLGLIQANIAQHHKWRNDLRADHFRRHVALSTEASLAGASHLIWPETATPYVLSRTPEARAAIAAVTPPAGLTLTGAVRATEPDAAEYQLWNSVHAVDADGTVVATYDKFHLVPFGEYVPLRGILSLAKLTVGNLDYSRGPGPRTLDLPGLPPVGPLICYEAIFPGQVTEPDRRPEWLLNVTNDAWYGISAGPYQHLAQARMRTIEQGLPLVRVANTGISAVFDPYGRQIAGLGLGEAGFVLSPLPTRLAAVPAYGRWGDVPLAAVCALVFGLAIGSIRLKNSRVNSNFDI